MLRKDLHEANRLAWNAATAAHNSHKADQAGFLKRGGTTLFPEEVGLLGDVHGLRLLHLQSNAGQDTLSIAQLGAVVTGVDISDTAVDFARRLSQDSGIPATFHRADIYDWLAEAAGRGEQFDVVFSSYGFLPWLSDLDAWAQGIASVLAPGGRVVLMEFHPFAMVFDDRWQPDGDYFGGGQATTWESGIGDYVALAGSSLTPSGYLPGVEDFRNPHPGHEYAWPLSAVVMALLDAGLQLSALREYPYFNGARLFEEMQAGPDNRWYPPASLPSLPLMFGLVARKSGDQAGRDR